MKRVLSILLILLVGSSLLASDKGDSWRSKHKRGFFNGGAGGWDLYMLPLNVDAINTELNGIGLNAFDDNMFLTGGSGWGYVGKNIRLGGMGFRGFVVSNATPDKIQKEVTLKLSLGGFTIEKAFHPFNNSEIYFGTMVGGGAAKLDLVQWSGPIKWDNVWNGYDIDSDTTMHDFYDYQTDLESHFFTLMPTIGFRYNIFRWCAVGVNVGYIYCKVDQNGWKMEGKRVSGVPDIDFSNVIYRFNVYFGG